MIYLSMIVVAFATITAGLTHYRGLVRSLQEEQARTDLLNQELGNKNSQISSLTETLNNWDKQARILSDHLEKARDLEVKNTEEITRLREVYREHDISALAQRKPGLMEKRINAASSDVMRLLECTTGRTCGTVPTPSTDSPPPAPGPTAPR